MMRLQKLRALAACLRYVALQASRQAHETLFDPYSNDEEKAAATYMVGLVEDLRHLHQFDSWFSGDIDPINEPDTWKKYVDRIVSE